MYSECGSRIIFVMSDLPSAVLLIGAAELEGELQVGNVITPLQLTPSHHHTTTSTLVMATGCISRSESGNVQLSTNCRVKYSSDLLLVHHTHCIVACCRLGEIILQNINISTAPISLIHVNKALLLINHQTFYIIHCFISSFQYQICRVSRGFLRAKETSIECAESFDINSAGVRCLRCSPLCLMTKCCLRSSNKNCF